MKRLGLCALLALVGCDGSEQAAPDAAGVDARPDAAVYAEERMPLTTSGTTPAGSLDDIHYLDVSFASGFCLPAYQVGLYHTNLTSEFLPEVLIVIRVPPGQTELPTGTIPAATLLFSSDDPPAPASFEVGHFDLPPTDPLRIAGRVTASTGAWSLDFTLDAQAPFVNCI